jgi:hypothetical protein
VKRPADEIRAWQFVGAAILLFAAVYAAVMQRETPAGSQFGYTPNPAGNKQFLDELGSERYFAQAAPEAMRKSAEVDTFLYRAMDKAHRARYGKPFVVGKQLNGSCVAWGAMHAVYCAESVSWDLGELSEPPLMPSTESIYGGARVEITRNGGKPFDGSRPIGGWSDGSYGGAAARWLRDFGVIYRQPYGDINLTTYNAALEKDWGAYGNGGQGDGGKLDATAKQHPCKYVVAVKTWQELVAAITAGFPCTIASSQGFTSTALASPAGLCEASGTWMHQMSVVAIRFAKNAPPEEKNPVDAALILNSWGPTYLRYEGRYPADQPAGSFWCRRAVMERILAQDDSWAVGRVDGWKWKDLHHGNWLMPSIDTLTRLPRTNKFLDYQIAP